MRRPPLLAALAALPLFAFACGDDDDAPKTNVATAGNGGAAGIGGSGDAGTSSLAGAAGTAGASQAGNGGQGGSGVDVCDTGSCLACTACINQETCKQPYQACFENNEGCKALAQCYLGCTAADCRTTCDAEADQPSVKAARAYLDCSLCQACQTTCGKDQSCK